MGGWVLEFPSPPKFEKEVRQIRSFYPDLVRVNKSTLFSQTTTFCVSYLTNVTNVQQIRFQRLHTQTLFEYPNKEKTCLVIQSDLLGMVQ